MGLFSSAIFGVTGYCMALSVAIAAPSPVPSAPPRALFFCGHCDQVNFARNMVEITKATRDLRVGLLKVGNNTEDRDISFNYTDWTEAHPEDSENTKFDRNFASPYGISNREKLDLSSPESSKRVYSMWKSQLQDAISAMDKTKPIVLHFDNHGLNLGDKPPENVGVACDRWGECITYKDIGDMLEKAGLTGPGRPPIRIIGNHCYSGGVHYLAGRFGNVCSASSVSYREEQRAYVGGPGEGGMAPFGYTFWHSLRENSRPEGLSFSEAFTAAYASMPASFNPGGNLSSTEYVEKTLKMDVKAKNGRVEQGLPEARVLERSLPVINDMIRNNQDTKYLDDPVWYYFRPADSGNKKGPAMPDAGMCSRPEIAPIDLALIASASAVLKKLQLDKSLNAYQEAVTKLQDPDYVKKGKAEVDATALCWKTARATYDAADASAREYFDKSRWSKEFLWDFGESLDEKKSAHVNAELEKMREAATKLKECVNQHSAGARDYLTQLAMLSRLNRLKEFSEKSTSSQKQKFSELVACESNPLF